jgi:hypothetical protein
MLRTLGKVCGVVLLCAGCGSDPYAGESSSTWRPPSTNTNTGTSTRTSTSITISTDYYVEAGALPIRKLDLVFMIDNSPGMAGKVAKMTAQLPKLFAALKDPDTGLYPDLRIAILDSDLGTGGAYSSGSCGPNSSNGSSLYGDVGNFQMRSASSCGVTSSDALWIEYTKGSPVNFTGDVAQVLSCLATNVGTMGCGYEHSLQAFEFAFVTQSLHQGPYSKQNEFLRPEAYLGLVFVTDEDDCSAATNDGLFGDKAELGGESASLRCASRAHRCDGLNLADKGAGYPTTLSFATSFSRCVARTDACPNSTDGNDSTDTSVSTTCSPLKSVLNMANEIKALKGAEADQKILVAGIFGWPRKGADGKADFTDAVYRIDLVPNPNVADTVHPQVYDYWPVCYDPDHMPTSSGFDSEAWGWGAPGGLRLAAFVDTFGTSGLKYSVCERDFSDAMEGIGGALAKKMPNRCVTSTIDSKRCAVYIARPYVDESGTVKYIADASPLSKCAGGGMPVVEDCYALVSDPLLCPGAQYLVNLSRTDAETAAGALPSGTKLRFICQ